jgi:hypothetical protein
MNSGKRAAGMRVSSAPVCAGCGAERVCAHRGDPARAGQPRWGRGAFYPRLAPGALPRSGCGHGAAGGHGERAAQALPGRAGWQPDAAADRIAFAERADDRGQGLPGGEPAGGDGRADAAVCGTAAAGTRAAAERTGGDSGQGCGRSSSGPGCGS